MNSQRIVSIIPYKILPASLGGEKGIAVFSEYLARQLPLLAVATENNDPAYAKNYRLLNILSNSRLRYVNPFLYFKLRKVLRMHRATHLLIEHPYYGWLAWLLTRFDRKLVFLVHSHNIEYMRSKSIGRVWWKLLKWYEEWAYGVADKVFFISEDDRAFAGQHMDVDSAKSIAVTYGIEQAQIPGDIAEARTAIEQLHGVEADEKILLFNGALYHHTNYDALEVILKEINPLLLQARGFRYKIIVCGKGLPAAFNELADYAGKNVIYAGFVDDIGMYFKAADIFLNPILAGGGVKTKAIEALAMNCTVISTELGAMGILREVCGGKLKVVKEGEWQKFRDLIIAESGRDPVPEAFFSYYYWPNIIRRVVGFIS